MGFTVKNFDDILADMVAYIVANSSEITDLSPGSVIRSFCEAVSLSVEEIYISAYLGFKRYLAEIPENTFGFERKAGTKATVNVVYSRTGTSGDVSIPAGTRLKTPSGLRFISDAGLIADGNSSSSNVEVTADAVGTEYNVIANSITIIEDTVTGAETVTNALAATGGVDIESDYNYNNRFQSYIEGLGRSNVAGLVYGALSVEGITSAHVQELFPPVANVNAYVYIDDGSASGVSTAKVTEVQTTIDGDGTEENPGYRSCGINVEVKKPTIVTIDIDVDVTPLAGVDTDQIQTDINTNLTNYVNNLGVGDDVIFNKVVEAVISVYGVSNCDVTDLDGGVVDVTITDGQVARLGTVAITLV